LHKVWFFNTFCECFRTYRRKTAIDNTSERGTTTSPSSTGKETRMTREQVESIKVEWTRHKTYPANTIRALCALALEALELRAENERLKENLMDAQGEIHYLKNRAEF